MNNYNEIIKSQTKAVTLTDAPCLKQAAFAHYTKCKRTKSGHILHTQRIYKETLELQISSVLHIVIIHEEQKKISPNKQSEVQNIIQMQQTLENIIENIFSFWQLKKKLLATHDDVGETYRSQTSSGPCWTISYQLLLIIPHGNRINLTCERYFPICPQNINTPRTKYKMQLQ